ncbi:MAG: DUF2442 domain-containing protein [Betaproteobacteria bacterium]|nr:DUF2442 domain-containing protein [Betaproteobacteria bacterium]
MNPRISAVAAHDDYALLLTFTNGEMRHFDMKPYLGYPVFEPLRQIAFFKLARASHGTVTWPREIDFDPDTLYLEGRPAKHEEHAAI